MTTIKADCVFIIMIYCLFGTQLAEYARSLSRKMFLGYFVFFAKTLQPSSVNTGTLKCTFKVIQRTL